MFVEKLGWQLRCDGDLEFDQFDREDTLYVVCSDDAGEIIGTARLLPTTGPYLLRDVFPQLFHDLPLPRSPEVWELSRFAAVDLSDGKTCSVRSPVASSLLRRALDCASELGAKWVVTVSPIGVERLLAKAGFRAQRAGPPLIVDGKPVVACWIEV